MDKTSARECLMSRRGAMRYMSGCFCAPPVAFLASKCLQLLPIITIPTALLALLAGCSGGVLDPQGPIGAADNKILFNALGIVLAIVGPTIVAVLVFAWWFRRPTLGRATYPIGYFLV